LAAHLGAVIKGDPEIVIRGVCSLDKAEAGHLSFVAKKKFLDAVPGCKASALIVPPELKDLDFPLLISEQPSLAFARAAQLFAEPPFLAPGVDPRAYVAEGAVLGPGAAVGPLAHVGKGCVIGAGSRIYGGAYLGSNVQVGEDCMIYPGVTILDSCRIGSRVIIHSGAVIGADGFGFAQDESGRHFKIPQMGYVQIDDDVEIGANSTIDRATFDRTWIQEGTKIDNLVMVAHNVVVGKHSLIISQTGISGSTRLGNHVILGGQVGLVGHIEIGDGARIGAKSGVNRSVKPREDISGIPAVPHKEFLRNAANVRRIDSLKLELRELKARVHQLEEKLSEE
jgi:UDP-3-O-[3-hydroxymyristoyl] glucosamine N-acyltransferase